MVVFSRAEVIEKINWTKFFLQCSLLYYSLDMLTVEMQRTWLF